ncbi:MAG TPA: hypothetical protein VMR74_01230 [Gammaproteobacteria bacterium]|nr:hypothetical protein [Gammaproteobacteria bacterium]
MKALLAVLAVLLASCAEPESEAGPEAGTPRAAARDTSVFDPVTIDPIERARGVQDTIFEADAERRRQIEAQELGN